MPLLATEEGYCQAIALQGSLPDKKERSRGRMVKKWKFGDREIGQDRFQSERRREETATRINQKRSTNFSHY